MFLFFGDEFLQMQYYNVTQRSKKTNHLPCLVSRREEVEFCPLFEARLLTLYELWSIFLAGSVRNKYLFGGGSEDDRTQWSLLLERIVLNDVVLSRLISLTVSLA